MLLQVACRFGWYLLILPCALCTSCGSGDILYPARGVVLYKGQPIEGAVVVFHPKGAHADLSVPRPSGLTETGGAFSLSTGNREGAPAGDYVVTVAWLQEPAEATASKVISTEPPPDPVDKLQGRYAIPAASKLNIRISKGVNELEPIKLE
jgi:hypothetical protein